MPEIRVYLEGPDAGVVRLSTGRNVTAPFDYARVDYDILVEEPVPHKNYNFTIIAEEVTGNHTSVCSLQLWDPHFVAALMYELIMMALKFVMTPDFDTRPRFSHCPPSLQASREHLHANEELVVVTAEAYLSEPNARLVGRGLLGRGLKLFAHNEPECRRHWHCTNYLIVNGRSPLNIAALGKFEIPLFVTANFGGTNASECRILFTAKIRIDALSEPNTAEASEKCAPTSVIVAENTTKAVAPSMPTPTPETAAQTSAWTTGLVLATVLTVASATFAVGCFCGHRMRRHGLVLLPTITWTRDGGVFELEPTRDDASMRTRDTSLSTGTDA